MQSAADEPQATPSGYREPRQPVEWSQVQDPVTGLPLRRYRFAGPAPSNHHVPLPRRAWRVLHTRQEGTTGVLESEFTLHAQPLARHPNTLRDELLDDLFDAVAEAHELGRVHGDLGVHRLYWHGRHVRIEGYGVPWRPRATVAEDVCALGHSLLCAPEARWSSAARARLRAVIASGNPRATAAGTPAALPTPTLPAAPPPMPPPPAATPPAALWQSPPPDPPPAPHGTTAAPRHDAPQVRRAPPRPRLPPIPLPHRSAWLALPALLLVGLLWWGWRSQPAVAQAVTSGHTLAVTLAPSGHPPATLVVLRSPEGSLFRPGSSLGSVPGPVQLDRPGSWIVQAHFIDAFSAPVEFAAPFDRQIHLTFPAAPTRTEIP